MLKNLYFKGENDPRTVRSWRKKLALVQKQRKPLDLTQSALMVIDMQRYFFDEKSHAFIPTGSAILPNVKNVLRLFRDKGRPVIFTRFALRQGEQDPVGDFWGRTVREGSRESAIVDALEPGADEKILRKTAYSSFYGTDLEKFLRSHDVESIVITGVLTHLCCEEAAREAFARGFDVFFVADATASFNEEVHLGSLMNLSSGIVTPVFTEDILTHSTVQ
jgi:bifunctional isochorismate lyase / aryl carrier protein